MTYREKMARLTTPRSEQRFFQNQATSRRRCSRITESKNRTWLTWTTADVGRESARNDGRIQMALGAAPTKLRYDIAELVRGYGEIRSKVVEAGILINEASCLEDSIQSHLNELNGVVESCDGMSKLGLGLIERTDYNKRGGKENYNHQQQGQRQGGGPGQGAGLAQSNGCYLCGSVRHWVRSCPERFANQT